MQESLFAKITSVFRRPSGRVLLLLCAMYFVTYIDRVNLSTAAPILQKELGLSNTQLGLVFSAFGYTYAVFQILGGVIGDKIGPRYALAVYGMIWSAATMLTGFGAGVISLFLARLLLGVGEGGAFPTASRSMADWFAPGRRGYAQGITHSFARLANTVTPPLVVFLVALTSWRDSFLILGSFSLIWVVVWFWYYRDDPRQHSGMRHEELKELPVIPPRNGRPPIPWRALLKRMWPTTLVCFCYAWTLWLYLTWIPSFFVQAYGMNIKSSAVYSFGVFFAGLVGDALGGILSDWLLRRTGSLTVARSYVMAGSMITSFLCMVPVLVSNDLSIVAFSLAAAFFFVELTIAPIWALPADIAAGHPATATGIMSTGTGLASIVSPFAFGWLADAAGSVFVPFIASMALLLVGAAFCFSIRPDRPLEEEVDPPIITPLITASRLA
jgi:sugar phosphate permease